MSGRKTQSEPNQGQLHGHRFQKGFPLSRALPSCPAQSTGVSSSRAQPSPSSWVAQGPFGGPRWIILPRGHRRVLGTSCVSPAPALAQLPPVNTTRTKTGAAPQATGSKKGHWGPCGALVTPQTPVGTQPRAQHPASCIPGPAPGGLCFPC